MKTPSEWYLQVCLEKWVEEVTMQEYGTTNVGILLDSCQEMWGCIR